jgi:hypothetical protein
MKPDVAIAALETLKEEATEAGVLNGGEKFNSWKAKVHDVLSRSLGADHDMVSRFDGTRYSLGMWSTSTPSSAFTQARHGGIRNACGVIDAAIYSLNLTLPDDEEQVDERAYDPELWEHVRGLVEAGDWGKVPANVAIFVEHKLRVWANDPKGSKAETLVGKGLAAQALADDGLMRLGSEPGEWEGWRFLAMGLAQAVGNVERHHIVARGDQRRYAVGVLGLGSLLLTQARAQHPTNTTKPDDDVPAVED